MRVRSDFDLLNHCGDGFGYRKIQPELKLNFIEVLRNHFIAVKEGGKETCWLKINPDLYTLDTTFCFKFGRY
jgi:hypothetical protein